MHITTVSKQNIYWAIVNVRAEKFKGICAKIKTIHKLNNKISTGPELMYGQKIERDWR